MLGAIFGDMAGSIYEFDNIKTTDFKLLGPGTEFTDDSVLTVAVADWLLQDDRSEAKLVETLRSYVRRYPDPMGAYGGGFLHWAYSASPHAYGSYGNGSAMRCSACGWVADTLEDTERIAAVSASVTHDHPEGIKGAQATAAAIFLARTGSRKKDISEYIENRFGYDLSRNCDDIRPTYEFEPSCQETVPQAIVAFLDSHDFESAIRLAVSLGGDSDTLACITGGIAEAFYGMNRTVYDLSDYPMMSTSALAVCERLPKYLRETALLFHDRFVRPHQKPSRRWYRRGEELFREYIRETEEADWDAVTDDDDLHRKSEIVNIADADIRYDFDVKIPYWKVCRALETAEKKGKKVHVIPDEGNECRLDGWTYHLKIM